MVVLCSFFHGTGLDDICSNLLCVEDEVWLVLWLCNGWILLYLLVVFCDGYHPEACGCAFFTAYYCSTTVSDLTSNHGELHFTSCVAKFGD